jgi:hypothetical protein
MDSYGDGLCCEYGLGHWEILNDDGAIISYSNGEFGESETDQFCTDDEPNGIDAFSNIEGLVYPNPANESLTIEFPTLEGRIVITDLEGRTIMNFNLVAETSKTLDVSSWSEGMYLITFVGADSEIITRRITITH